MLNVFTDMMTRMNASENEVEELKRQIAGKLFLSLLKSNFSFYEYYSPKETQYKQCVHQLFISGAIFFLYVNLLTSTQTNQRWRSHLVSLTAEQLDPSILTSHLSSVKSSPTLVRPTVQLQVLIYFFLHYGSSCTLSEEETFLFELALLRFHPFDLLLCCRCLHSPSQRSLLLLIHYTG